MFLPERRFPASAGEPWKLAEKRRSLTMGYPGSNANKQYRPDSPTLSSALLPLGPGPHRGCWDLGPGSWVLEPGSRSVQLNLREKTILAKVQFFSLLPSPKNLVDRKQLQRRKLSRVLGTRPRICGAIIIPADNVLGLGRV